MRSCAPLLLLLAVGCSSNAITSTPGGNGGTSDRVQKLIGGEAALATIRKPDKIEAFRHAEKSYPRPLEEYEVVKGPVEVSPELGQQLADLLTADNSYRWEVAKVCEPDYGVRIRFTRGERQVNVLFCFGCDILEFLPGGKSEDFDSIRPQLVKIVKQIFPEEKF